MSTLSPATDACLAQLEAILQHGEELIGEQHRRIAQIEAEGGEARAAREALKRMQTMQNQMLERCRLARRYDGGENESHSP